MFSSAVQTASVLWECGAVLYVYRGQHAVIMHAVPLPFASLPFQLSVYGGNFSPVYSDSIFSCLPFRVRILKLPAQPSGSAVSNGQHQ
jgi:hypothetical protein